MNFRGFTQTIPKKSYLQKKAEEAHKIFEGLGPKVELVSCGILFFFFCSIFCVASCSNSVVLNSCSSVMMYRRNVCLNALVSWGLNEFIGPIKCDF